MAMIKSNQFTFTKDCMEILSEYKDLVMEDLVEASKATAKDAVKELKSTSPKGSTKKYAKGWTSKVTEKSSHSVTVTVHNKDEYRLAHLLEHGHAVVSGGRTVGHADEHVHIATAEANAEKNLEKRITELVRKAK